MQKPVRFTLVHKLTKEEKPFVSYRSEPITEDVSGWVETSPGIRQKQIIYDVYEDMRYKAKLRLFNYLTYTKQGKEIPTYKPYAGTEIGKTIPILNF